MTRSLVDIAYVRAGDKGDCVSVGVLARQPDFYPEILASVTPKALAALYGEWAKGPIEVFPMPNIDGCLVLMHDALGGSATNTLRFDQTAKALGTAILRLPVIAP
jgi:hypothetical protein